MPTDSEETPLLHPDVDLQDERDAAFLRFTDRQKRIILAIVSWTGLLPCVSFLGYPRSRWVLTC
jgi:hypothetical protein